MNKWMVGCLAVLVMSAMNSFAYDINRDGYEEIIVSHFRDGSDYTLNSYIYWGDATGSFANRTELPTVGGVQAMVDDLNQDGYYDITFCNYRNGDDYSVNSYIYWGDASHSYSNKTELATNAPRGSAAADLNGDGYRDIVFANNVSSTSYIYWGDAGYTYSSRTDLSVSEAFSTSIADLNGDNHPDIVFASHDSFSYIYWGADTSPYTTSTRLQTYTATDSSIADLNKDGHLDLVFSSYENASRVIWGDPSASYSDMTIISHSLNYGAYGNSVADLDNDGYMDIVLSNRSTDGWSSIYWGDASYDYTTRTPLDTEYAHGNTVADVNGDGHLDILFANFDDVGTYIYLGDASASYSSRIVLDTGYVTGIAAGTDAAYGQSFGLPYIDPQATPIPEPMSVSMIVMSLIGFLVRRKLSR